MRFVGRLSLLVLLPVLGLVALATYLTVYFSNASSVAYESVLRVNEEIETVQGLFSDLQDAETGVRGYVITQNPVYLESYNQALTRVPGRLERLSRVSDPERAQLVAALRPLVTERLQVLNIAVEGMVRGDRETVVQSVASGRGKALMDEIRRQIADFIALERRLFEQGHAQSSESDRFTLYTAVGGSLVALIALVVGTILLLANNWRLQRAEGQLLRQRQILQNTLDNIRHGIAHFDAKGRLAAFNRRFLTKLEFPSELGRPNSSIEEFKRIEKERGTEVLSTVQEGSAAGTPLAFRMSGHEYEIYRTATPDGGFVISCVDVTERTRAEEMFRHTQKMESLGQLTGGVAHDFNNLLQIIASNIDLVRASPQEPRNRQRLDMALSGAERGARLTRQLLAFARRQPLEPRPTNLARLVGDLTELIRRSLGEAIEVETVVAGGLWNAMADQGQMENAILNLAINGRDAMPDGGKLTIELANTFLDEAYAAAHAEVSAGQYVMLAVSDTGIGMPPDVVARAFEPFFSTKPEGQGTGLGLSQVYGYAKQLGGHVKIYSEAGHGTTVKMYLPRTRQPEDSLAAVTLAPIEPGRETVLVVEDDAIVREGAIDMLNDLGYRVLQASNAEAALAIIGSGAAIDILFTDVVMPGPIKTRDFVRQAQARIAGLAVLYTSGYTENAIIHDGRLDADVLLISKPYRREELARKLRTALDHARRGNAEPAVSVNAAAGPAPSSMPPQPKPVVAQVEQQPQASVQAGPVVLFVEDDALVRMTAVDHLEYAGMRVIPAANAELALQALKQHPEIEVMLTDLGLPGIDGAELIQTARKLRPDLPVAVLTGRSREVLVQDGIIGADVLCLEKPYELEALSRAVHRLIGKV
jgi:signal transduction histidine kinase/DNA-binding response OmpR family regulator